MRTLFLQFQKNIGQAGYCDLPSGLPVGNFMILAVHTAKVTAAEKNGAGTVCAGQAWFLPEMERRSCGSKPCILSAVTDFTGVSVDVTFSWAERTI